MHVEEAEAVRTVRAHLAGPPQFVQLPLRAAKLLGHPLTHVAGGGLGLGQPAVSALFAPDGGLFGVRKQLSVFLCRLSATDFVRLPIDEEEAKLSLEGEGAEGSALAEALAELKAIAVSRRHSGC